MKTLFFRVKIKTKEPIDHTSLVKRVRANGPTPVQQPVAPHDGTLEWSGWTTWGMYRHESKMMVEGLGYTPAEIVSLETAESEQGPFTAAPGHPKKW